MNNDQMSVDSPGVKILTAWGAVGITSWADFASFAAAIYTVILIGEWCWKKFGRAFAENRGWVKPKVNRRRGD